MRRVWIAGLIACAAAPVAARAQEGESGLGLDLSTETSPPKPDEKPPAGASGFELDLSAEDDYRPPIAYLGVALGEAGATPDAKGSGLLAKLDELLGSTVRKARQFSAVQPRALVRAKLGDEPDEILRCADPSCFEAAASKLGAERLFLGLLYLPGGRPYVRLVAYARGQAGIETQDVPADASLRAAAAARISSAADAVLSRVAAPLGKLKVSTNVPDAEVSFDGVALGNGGAEALVRAGKRTVRAAAPGYEPQDVAIQVQSGQTKEISLELARVPPKAAAPVAAIAPPKRAPRAAPATVFLQRPGLYVALAGVAAAGAGVAFGISAKGTEARAIDGNGDGILDITRAQMLSARTNALLANVLVPAGLAMAAGGAAWMFWPTAKVGRSPGEPAEVLVGLAAAGSF